MTTKIENPPAFPLENKGIHPQQEGMTLLDWFAAHAMNGIQSQLRYNADEYHMLASAAYAVATAMLKARQQAISGE